MSVEQECWWEKQGMRGCAACPIREDWLKFVKGKGLNEKCRPKMERTYGKANVEKIARGEIVPQPRSGTE